MGVISENSPTFNANKTRRDLLFLIFFTLILIIPFINKPFHIDAPAFISPYKTIFKTPLNPYGFSELFQGIEADFFENMPHPPFISYLVSLAIYFSGGVSEIIIHTFFFIFPFIAVISMYLISKTTTENPLIPTILILITPAFLVESSQVTSDMPFLALLLFSIATYIYGIKYKNKYLLALSIISSNFLIITRYIGLLIIPLLFLYSLLEKVSIQKTIKMLSFTIVLLLFWSILNLITHRELHIFKIIKNDSVLPLWMGFNYYGWVNNFIGVISHLSGSTMFLFLIPFLRPATKRYIYILIASFLFAVIISVSYISSYEMQYKLLFVIFFGSGIYLFLLAVIKAKKQIFLLAWLLIIFFINIFILPFGCARYNLPLLPPLILLLFNQMEEIGNLNSLRRLKIVIPIIVFISILISIADYQFASYYKNISKKIADYIPEFRKWNLSSWELDYYLTEKNILPIDYSMIKENDLIIYSKNTTFYPLRPDILNRSVLLREYPQTNRLPIRILDKSSHAGFYSTGWGFLPISFSNGEIERITVLQVR
jgi:hypothetical protein